MNQLFEAFVRNYYRKKHPGWRVSRSRINWQFSAVDSERSLQYLPIMETDITIDQDYNLTYQYDTHHIMIKTLNLNMHWSKIEERLEEIVELLK